MKKLLSMIILAAMLIPVFISCANTDDNTDNTDTTTVVNGSETESLVDSEGYLLDNLPDDLNFDTTVNIMYWSDVEQPEFVAEGLLGEIVNDAIYNRNLETETRLGITLNWVGTLGNYGNQASFINNALNSISAGGEFDIFAGYSMTGATLAVNGYAQDLKKLNYLDFEMPWWPHSLIGKATINDKLYFASGDISTNMLHMMYAVFFNKQMIIDNSLKSPYELVDSGNWTYSKMFEMSSEIYTDTNGNTVPDINDRFGFATGPIHYDAFFTGAGLNTVEKDVDDHLVISSTFNSEKTITLLEDICSFMWAGADGYHGATGAIFALDNTLFTLDRSYMALLNKDDIDFEYGILPVPKFDSNQEDHVTCLGFPYTMYAISIASPQTEVAAATLECLGSMAFRLTTPMLFETTMKYKYASDDDSVGMYDIIRSSVSIDIGRIFTTELNNLSYSMFRNSCVKNAASTWPAFYRGNSKVFEKLLKSINDSLSELTD